MAELTIFYFSTASLNISPSAHFDAASTQQQSMNYFYLLQLTVVIPTGVQVVLELVDGTEPSVELGPNATVTVTIVSSDIVCSIPTGELFTIITF